MYIALCDSVTLGLVIYLLYIFVIQGKRRETNYSFVFALFLIFLQLKKKIKNRSLTLQDRSGDA